MDDTNILFNGKITPSYYQVGLIDNENKDSYPQWKTGEEVVVFGIHGVAVGTANDQLIDILVYSGKLKIQYALCVSGEIIIGRKGIIVGNEISADTNCIDVPSGKYSVTVYTDKIGPETTQVVFCIDRIGNK